MNPYYLKFVLFYQAWKECERHKDMVKIGGFTTTKLHEQHVRYCALYDIIVAAKLEDEYKSWKADLEATGRDARRREEEEHI